MYEYMNGKITEVESTYIVLEVSGIGYLINVANPYSYSLGEDYGTEALETALSEKKIENIDFSKEQHKEIAEQMVRHEDFDASATTGKALIDEDYESVVSNEIEVKEDEEVLIKKPSFYHLPRSVPESVRHA